MMGQKIIYKTTGDVINFSYFMFPQLLKEQKIILLRLTCQK